MRGDERRDECAGVVVVGAPSHGTGGPVDGLATCRRAPGGVARCGDPLAGVRLRRDEGHGHLRAGLGQYHGLGTNRRGYWSTTRLVSDRRYRVRRTGPDGTRYEGPLTRSYRGA
jgi:hypothetical protein